MKIRQSMIYPHRAALGDLPVQSIRHCMYPMQSMQLPRGKSIWWHYAQMEEMRLPILGSFNRDGQMLRPMRLLEIILYYKFPVILSMAETNFSDWAWQRMEAKQESLVNQSRWHMSSVSIMGISGTVDFQKSNWHTEWVRDGERIAIN